MKLIICAGLLFTSMVVTSCQYSRGTNETKAAIDSIKGDEIAAHIKTLASDEYEGRAPASKGEELTIKYLADQFKKLGLKPGNADGTYLQRVPLVGITADPSASLVFSRDGRREALKYADDFQAVTRRMVDEASINEDLVFVGYGVVAPEFNWDDYKGVDVKGKVLVMLINDPPVPDEHIFGGKAMTYYGRWTYKYEIAAEKHAAGCLIIHETGPAGYPWGVIKGSWTGEQFTLVTPDKNMGRAAVEGWITREKAEALFKMAGKDFEVLKKEAATSEFRPVDLGVKASLTIKSRIRTIDSHNVLAKLEGSDPKLKDDYVVYTAHWDHLGIGPAVNGDRIYNGAVDNASGCAGLLELAKAFARLSPPPRRSILFLSVTAEEKGLLGSRYYAENPAYPLTKTVANINIDGMNVLGKTKDIIVIGLGNSTLDDYVKQAAGAQGRTVKPDEEAEKRSYYRSDHFNFPKVGVPALTPN